MSDRKSLARTFLSDTDWAGATVNLLAGDASNRKYYRLSLPGTIETAVLMYAPKDKGEDIRPFVKIARYLSGLGLSAPRIIAEDAHHGFLLLEDLGDDLFARVLEADETHETLLYTAATDALIELHRHGPPPGLAPYDSNTMADMAALAFDWYAKSINAPDPVLRETFKAEMINLLDRGTKCAPVLIQRDYHAENLLWLSDRVGIARVGLLDFQDAMLGHPAYDLVSLLQDARRDVPRTIEAAMIKHYVAQTDVDQAEFDTAYHCLGAQRNLRILGVFARLCMRDGKPGYVDLIPRVWGHLQKDLEHPKLTHIEDMLHTSLPSPTPENLEKIREQCATIPAQ